MVTGATRPREVDPVNIETKPCGSPLFGADVARGICRGCASGWEVDGNRYADPAERSRALASATLDDVERAALDVGASVEWLDGGGFNVDAPDGSTWSASGTETLVCFDDDAPAEVVDDIRAGFGPCPANPPELK